VTDVVAAWRGVLEAAKIRPRLARYRPADMPLKTCGLCGNHDGSRCALIAGIVADNGTCDLWRAAGERRA
jgi:hypothetical protein